MGPVGRAHPYPLDGLSRVLPSPGSTPKMPDEDDRRFRLHFEGPLTRGHSVPAPALVQALQQFQRVVHLLAMAEEGREVRQKARVTHDIDKLFPLVCSIPQEGGYGLLVVLGDTTHQLFDAQIVQAVADRTRGVLAWTHRNRRALMVNTTRRPCDGRSVNVRRYRLWMRGDTVPQLGQAAVMSKGRASISTLVASVSMRSMASPHGASVISRSVMAISSRFVAHG